MEDDKYYKLLVQRFANRTATDDELEVFIKLAREGKLDQYLTETMNEDAGITQADEQVIPVITKTRRLWPRVAAAAAILLVLSFGGYFYMRHNATLQNDASLYVKNNIAPGKNTATLTLANGQKIILAETTTGQIAQQAGVNISKSTGGQITYTITGTRQLTANQLNTLSTARGETYKVILPDGTQVWLNAASSLTYPAVFSGAERHVTLTGEGYFEVAKDKAHPFKVKTNLQEVTVLGTHFNINAYSEERDTKTTLLEGSVKVNSGTAAQTIKPGEQAATAGTAIKVKQVETSQAVAWKDNNFAFDGETLPYIMRMVERWYNVEVIYEGYNAGETFYGGVSRYENVSEVLKSLESTRKVHFRIEGRKIFVTP